MSFVPNCRVSLLPLCSIPARQSRDGNAGVNASIYVPFYGYYFFNGSTFSNPASTIPQDTSLFVSGVSKQGSPSVGGCASC